MLLKAQMLVPNSQRVHASALTLANVGTLGNNLNTFDTPFSYFLNGGNISLDLKEVVVMAIMHGLLAAHPKSLINGSRDYWGCWYHERIKHSDSSASLNATAHQHSVSANTTLLLWLFPRVS